MRIINRQTWSRRAHFEKFGAMNHPHFGLTANVDLAVFYPYVKARSIRMTTAVVYILSRAANAIPEFRTRLREDAIVEHDLVHPSITVLGRDNLFGFCFLPYTADFARFAAEAEDHIARAQAHADLEDPPGRDDLLFMTAIPWVSFTSFTHPMQQHPADSVPRFAWGKFFEDGRSLQMPLAVQAHHGLMDGLHLGRYYETVQTYLDDPQAVFEA